MRPYEKVTILRKNGNLQEAYRLATDWYKAKPKDPWRQLALFWVLRDLCKQAYATRQFREAESHLNAMSDLLPTLPDTKGAAEKAYQSLLAQVQPDYQLIQSANQHSTEDPVGAFELVKACYARYEQIHRSLHETLGWILYRYLKHQREVLPTLSIRKALALYLKMGNPRPSRLHSLFLHFATQYSRDHGELRLYPFFLLWDPSKLQTEDLLPTYMNNSTYPSLIDQVLQRIVPLLSKEEVGVLIERLPFSMEQSLDYIRQAYLNQLIVLSRGEDIDAVWRMLNQYLEVIPQSVPSKAHTGVLLFAHQIMQGDEGWRFVRFWLRWGVESFQESDWYPTMEAKLKGQPSVVETVAKHAFSQLDNATQRSPVVLERISGFFHHISLHAKPNEWALHRLASIESWRGNKEEAIALYKKILLDNRDNFRYWLALSQLVKDRPETHVALCCKTLFLENDPERIGDLRLDLAQSLLSIGQSAEALSELKQYKEHHPQPTLRYQQLLQNIETRVTILPAPGSYYERRLPQAEDFVFQDFPIRKFVLVSRMEQVDGSVARLSDGEDILLNVPQERFPILRTLRLGTVVKMRLRESKVYDPTRIVTGSTYRIDYEPLSCTLGNNPAWSQLPLYQATVVATGAGNRSLSLRTDDGVVVTCYTEEKPPIGARVSFRGYFQPLKEGKRLEVAILV